MKTYVYKNISMFFNPQFNRNLLSKYNRAKKLIFQPKYRVMEIFFFSLFFFIWYLFQHDFCVVVWFGFIHIETCVSLFQIMLLKQKIIISFNYKSLFVRREKIPFLGIIPITWNCLLCMNFLIVTTLKFSFSWEKNLKRKSSI